MAAIDVKMYSIIILISTLLIQSQEVEINNTTQLLNEAKGFITIGQHVSKRVTLTAEQGKLLKKMVQNLNSIGFMIEPENIWNEMKNIQNDNDMATFASQEFQIKIVPNKVNGLYVKPSRNISQIEGQKLEGALMHLKNHGLIINVENF